MADITMCLNATCPKKTKCYRKTATPSEHWQSLAVFKYGFDEAGLWFCESYWPVKDRVGRY